MERTIRVTGKGMLKLTPDTVRLRMELNDTGKEYEAVFRKSMEHAEQVKEAFALLGFDKSDLKTIHFEVNTEYEQYQDKRNNSWKRAALRGCLWSDKKKSWKDITPEERDRAAKIRVQAHNKCLRYHATLQENVRLLQSFGVWCQERGIQLIFLIFPVSQSYDRYLDPRFKKAYYEMLKGFSFPFEFRDLMEQAKGMKDAHFNDTDHLNDLGAQRLTAALKAVLPERVADK